MEAERKIFVGDMVLSPVILLSCFILFLRSSCDEALQFILLKFES